MKPILYGIPVSPFYRKIRIQLLEKNIDHQIEVLLPLEKTPELLKLTPLGKIPVLKDKEGRIVNDSSVIFNYIEDVYGENPLLPKNPYEKSRARWFEEYADSHFFNTAVVQYFFQKCVGPYVFGQPTDETIVEKAEKEDMPKMFDYLSQEIEGKEYFAGESFGLADIALGAMFANLQLAEYKLGNEYTSLQNWLEKTLSRPSFKTTSKEDSQNLKHIQSQKSV
ncbi:glutathione S-transferase family protein [Candidatus Uabimicrobium sp. HlEnr_7]|uniref:glutathione S-transferase family protein n=1 Tax=Candidatus Uabimicrobium helgolandensis TaxID=3095367 RepID=UPI003556206E